MTEPRRFDGTENLRPRGCAWVLGSALFLGATQPIPAQPPTPAGDEFQVNTSTTGSQGAASVGVDAEGGFVVVWHSPVSGGTDGDSFSIQGRRYASDGSEIGAEFQVNSYTTDLQRDPSVDAGGDGDFVVVWRSEGSSGTDSQDSSIQGQRYASDGSELGAEFQVNTYTTDRQWIAEVAGEADGDFVVVWSSYESPSDAYWSIQGQRYGSDGSQRGTEFQVNTYTITLQSSPSIALDGVGDFVVVWESFGSDGTDNISFSVQGQRFASDGLRVGSEFQVNTYTTSFQGQPSVAADGAGGFVVVWESFGSSGPDFVRPVQGQSYASDGTRRGGEFQINTYATDYQFAAALGMNPDGDFVVAWSSLGSGGSDTDDTSVQGQRYAGGIFADGFESGSTSAWSSSVP